MTKNHKPPMAMDRAINANYLKIQQDMQNVNRSA